MKRSLILLLCGTSLLNACSLPASRGKVREEAAAPRKPALRTTADDGTPISYVDGVEIQKVPFRAGVSSATVENLAKQQGCQGGWGAGLVSEPGPVEVYRMTCENGKVFMARCELKQCKAM
ncbi:hypothetical protein [Rugamonas aquatica]|uniref:Lipoprotein n=1 Tax=Rugamonas aquatica TaxID=2743357 RepID=A0A6A7NBR9_9BURK|nr:hypothetical protein [Rugamonas aquatica]MQA42630.1 hypothetical protein [Rugamonas aquatica]